MDNNPFRKPQQNTVASNSNYMSPNLSNSNPQQQYGSTFGSTTEYNSSNYSQSNPINQQQQPWQSNQNAMNLLQQPSAYMGGTLPQQQPFTTGTYPQTQQPFSSPAPSAALSPSQPTSGFGVASSFSQPSSTFSSYTSTPQSTIASSGMSAATPYSGLPYSSGNPTMMSPSSSALNAVNSSSYGASTTSFPMPPLQTGNSNTMYSNSSNNQISSPQQQPYSPYQQPQNQPFHFMPQLGMTSNPANGMFQPQQQRHAPVDARSLLKADQIRKVECPVCNKILEGDDIAINHHVNQHYGS